MYILTSELEQEVSMMKSYDKRTIDTDILPAQETHAYRFICTSCNATLNFNRSLDLKYEMIK